MPALFQNADADRTGFGACLAARVDGEARVVAMVQIASGALRLGGDASVLTRLVSTIVDFDPRFQIMPGTKVRDTGSAKAGPYEAVPRQTIAE